MPRARALAPLVALLVVAGCGGADRRETVAGYIEEANAVQQRFAPAVTQANAVYAEQARGRLAPARQLPGLERSGAALAAARAELGRLEPPAPARRLHADLLRVLELNAVLAEETVRLARYARAAPRALEPLGKAGGALRRDLKADAPPAEQARALDAYSGAMSKMVREMGALEVPVVLRPTHRAQVRRLLATRTLTRRLRRAAADADARTLARLLLRFRRLNGSTLAQRELAAKGIAAYTERLRRLDGAEARLVREQLRLNREVA